MIDKAIEKINAAMQKDPDNRYMEIVGHYIIDRCVDEETAAKVTDEKKTLKGAMDAVVSKAQKAKQGNVAVLMPDEVFGVVDQYFGLPTDLVAQAAAMGNAAPNAAPAPQSKQVSQPDIDLMSFL